MPPNRQWFHDLLEHHVGVVPAIEDCGHDARCKQAQAQHPAGIGLIYALCLGELGNRHMFTPFDHPPPAMSAGERLKLSIVNPRLWQCRYGVGKYGLTAAANRECHRDMHCDRGLVCGVQCFHAASFLCPETACKSWIKPASPAVRSVMSAPFSERSTRPTRS